MQFEISNQSRQLIDTWLHTRVYPLILEQQKASAEFVHQIARDTLDREIPYSGAIGGELTYSFTPTSLGTIIKVKHSSGAELDLTFYESW
jgi:hypothetical protein